MTRFRISGPTREDLAHILAISEERWGEARRIRYAELLAAAMRSISRAPEGPATRDRIDLSTGVRSFHVRHAPGVRRVKDPVHVIFFRVSKDAIEIVRVLHERMEPSLHIAAVRARKRSRR